MEPSTTATLAPSSCLYADEKSTIGDDWVAIQLCGRPQRFPGGGNEDTMSPKSFALDSTAPCGVPSLCGSTCAGHQAQQAREAYHAALLEHDISRKNSQTVLLRFANTLISRHSGDSTEIEALIREMSKQDSALDRGLQEVLAAGRALHSPTQTTNSGGALACASLDDCWSQCESDDSVSETAEALMNVVPAVEEFFRRARLEFIAKERLEDHDWEQKNEAGLFAWESSSSKSLEAWQLKRQALVEALCSARQHLEAQRGECLASGVDPEKYRYRRLSCPDLMWEQ